jgi:3-hydroxyisobutyrate dehydrogenase
MNQRGDPKPRIAFLGLGAMGSGMARRILAAGFPLAVFNRSSEKAAALAAEGARVAASPRAAVAGAEIVISMVSDDNASRAVWMGEDGALRGVGRGSVLIESSTVSLDWVSELASAAAGRGCEFLDAPVSGSKPEADSGGLRIFVGGSEAALEKVRPVLAAMGRLVVHLGGNGNGAKFKLINNFLVAVQIASMAEALALIERSDLDRTQAVALLVDGAPGSPILKIISDRMTTQSYDPKFLLRLMAKDLGYAAREGGRHSVPMATAAAAIEVFNSAIAAGYGEKDMSAIVEPFRKR